MAVDMGPKWTRPLRHLWDFAHPEFWKELFFWIFTLRPKLKDKDPYQGGNEIRTRDSSNIQDQKTSQELPKIHQGFPRIAKNSCHFIKFKAAGRHLTRTFKT